MIFGIWALFAEFVRDIAVEAAQENVALRRVRGDKLGRLPYGDRPGDRPDLVIAAWNETHSLTGTAQKLNRDGVQTWSGKPWTLTSVRQTMKRVAPGLIPSMGVTVGAKPVSRFALYRLVRCSCGETTTASHRRGGAQVQYQCQKGRVRPGHGRHQVAESVIPP